MKHSVLKVLIIAFGLFASAAFAGVHPKPIWKHTVNLNVPAQVEWALDRSFKKWEGTEYKFGGMSLDGVDCSGYVHMTYRESLGFEIPRSTELLQDMGHEIDRDELRPGDLVFFKTSWTTRHVGVYAGHGEFMHASTSKGVMKSRMDNPYWDDVYWKAVRP